MYRRTALTTAVLSALSAAPLAAEAPSIVTDIAAVHSIVSKVVGDLSAPDLILPPGVSPHGFALRPSDARALQDANVVFWVDEGLTPWFAEVVETLGEDATNVMLSSAEGVTTHDFRETAVFGGEQDDHGHEDHKHEEHGHAGHKHEEHGHAGHDDHDGHEEEHGHEEEEEHHDENGHDAQGHHESGQDEHGHGDHDHDEHEEEHHDAHEEHGHDHHDHEGLDPHMWLDPLNAQAWTAQIAKTLAALDPENAATYEANAADYIAELQTLTLEIQAKLADLGDLNFVVFHDAYQYFEKRFDVVAMGAISEGDASRPSPSRVREIRTAVQENGIRCVFAEPQFNPGLVKAISSGTNLKALEIDPLGTEIEPGAEFYAALISSVADVIFACGEK